MTKARTSKETLTRIVCCFLLLVLNLVLFARRQAPIVWEIPEKSFLSDYCLEDDRVHFLCHLELYNRSLEHVKVGLTGNFEADKKSGLVQEQYLTATGGSGSKSFILPPGRSVLDVEFVGTYGGSDGKQNRLLPEIHVTVIDPHAEPSS